MQVDSLPAEPPGKPKNTGVGSLSLLQRIFPTQELNLGLLHCRWILCQLSYEGSPNMWWWFSLIVKLCPTLCGSMDCSPPGSSVHGILQARILEWVAISFSILFKVVYICQSHSPSSSHPALPTTPTPTPWCPYVCSVHLCLYFCFANRFTCIIF